MDTGHDRRAITVIELFTVTLIAGMLAMLILPALALSAADARATTCQSKLLQLGLDLHNYEAGKRAFPSVTFTLVDGGLHSSDCRPADCGGGKSTTGYSWMTLILPMAEEIELYRDISEKSRRFTVKTGPFDPRIVRSNDALRHASCVVLSEFVCPEWQGNKYTHDNRTIDVGRAANTDEPAEQGAPEYAAVDSATPAAGAASLKGFVAPTCYKPMVGTHMWVGMPVENGGMVVSHSGLTLGSFADGLAKTILLCESKECGYASWYDGTLNWLVANDPNSQVPGTNHAAPWVNATLALNKGFDAKLPNSVPYLKKSKSANQPQNDVWWGPSSDHVKGLVYHVFVDGHTLGITDACDPATYLALVTRSGGETIDDTRVQ